MPIIYEWQGQYKANKKLSIVRFSPYPNGSVAADQQDCTEAPDSTWHLIAQHVPQADFLTIDSAITLYQPVTLTPTPASGTAGPVVGVQITENNPTTTTDSGGTGFDSSSALSGNLSSTANINTGNILLIGSELLKVTSAPVGTVVPVNRGVYGTTAVSHAAGTVAVVVVVGYCTHWDWQWLEGSWDGATTYYNCTLDLMIPYSA